MSLTLKKHVLNTSHRCEHELLVTWLFQRCLKVPQSVLCVSAAVKAIIIIIHISCYTVILRHDRWWMIIILTNADRGKVVVMPHLVFCMWLMIEEDKWSTVPNCPLMLRILKFDALLRHLSDRDLITEFLSVFLSIAVVKFDTKMLSWIHFSPQIHCMNDSNLTRYCHISDTCLLPLFKKHARCISSHPVRSVLWPISKV